MERYRRWVDGRDGKVVQGGAGEGGEWEARSGLNLLLGLFGLAMNPRSASHSLKHANI